MNILIKSKKMNDTDFGFADGFEDFVKELESKTQPQTQCSIENPEECEACGS